MVQLAFLFIGHSLPFFATLLFAERMHLLESGMLVLDADHVPSPIDVSKSQERLKEMATQINVYWEHMDGHPVYAFETRLHPPNGIDCPLDERRIAICRSKMDLANANGDPASLPGQPGYDVSLAWRQLLSTNLPMPSMIL